MSDEPRRAPQRVWSFALVILVAGSGLLTGPARAAEQDRPIRIGALNASWGSTPGVVGLRDGLLELGYRENEDFVLGVRFTQGNLAALPTAAQELVQHGVDLIFASTGSPVQAARTATSQIPIVFYGVGNPVGLGLIESFARPGSNTTGVTELHAELGPKRLEVFQEIIPDLKRVVFPYNLNEAQSVVEARAYREAARSLRIELVEHPVQTEAEAQTVIAQVDTDKVDGILVPFSVSLNIPGLVLAAISQRAIPTMFAYTFLAERGGLASYGPDLYESGRQAARLVDKILKGTDPADIPVEVNTKIMFSINLKVAKALGLTITPEVLYRADRIIR